MKKLFLILLWFFLFIGFFCQEILALGHSSDCSDFAFEAEDIEENQYAKIKLHNKTGTDTKVAIILNPTQPLAKTQSFCINVPAGETIPISSPKGIAETTKVKVDFHRYTGSQSCSSVTSFSGKPYAEQLCFPIEFDVKAGPERQFSCQLALDKEWYRPQENPVVTITNTSTHEAHYFIFLFYPGRATPYRYPRITPTHFALQAGESKTITLETTPSIDTVSTAKVEGWVLSTGIVWDSICDTKEFQIAFTEEQVKQTLQLFQPQKCPIRKEYYDETGWHAAEYGIQTALGCIPTEIKPLVSWLFKYAISIAGGIAFLMIIFSAFQMITSAGDPEKLEKAKQMLGSAIAGLLFIIFAVFLLQVIGADILKIF